MILTDRVPAEKWRNFQEPFRNDEISIMGRNLHAIVLIERGLMHELAEAKNKADFKLRPAS